MEQLVIYFSASDGCSYSYDQSIPVEYESAEQLLMDFDEALNAWRETDWRERRNTLVIGHLSFDINTFQHYDGKDTYYEAPEILTLTEWFEKAKSVEV